MASGIIPRPKAVQLTVTSSGVYSTTRVYAYKCESCVVIGGYFTNTSATSGNIATISGVNVPNAGDLSSPCQCDDNSVKWVSFSNSDSNLIVTNSATLSAGKYVRFLATLPLS